MERTYPLRQKLPAEVLVGGNAVWSRYRQYPVFGLRWLLGRSLLFCSVIAVVAAFIGMGTGVVAQDVGVAIKVAITEFVVFSSMATLGPALATAVRHRAWPLSRERKAVVIAVLIGMVLSFFIDRLGSSYIEQLIKPGLEAAGLSVNPPTPPPLVKAIGLAINVAALVVIYGLFGGGLALRAYFSEHRRWDEHHHVRELNALESRVHEADLRLGVLQAQVEPHFLFNTLHAIVTLLDEDTLSAEDMLLRLSELLRAFLEDYDGQEIPLRRELELLELYLGIQRRRFRDRLTTRIHVAPDVLDAAVPSLVLQPIVENAIRYGIGQHVGDDCVEIDCRREDGMLCIDVRNHNSTLDEGGHAGGHGIGLSNTRLRMRELYGDRASLRLDMMVPRGVACRLRLPFHELDEELLPEHVPA